MIFKASLGKTAKIVTTIVIVVFLGIICIPYFFDDNVPPVIPLLLIPILFIAYCYSPKHYEVTDNQLIIKRPLDKVTINRSEIKEVVKLEKGKLRFAIRTFGSGGLFGFYGYFYNNEFGNMLWYATKTEPKIMIITAKNKIVLTPDDVDGFIDKFRN